MCDPRDSRSGWDFVGAESLHNDIYPAIDPSTNPDLHQPGKIVLITGAGRGIGRAIALQYANAAVSLIAICARTSSELDEVEGAIQGINPEVRVWKQELDVTDNEGVRNFADAFIADQGRLDVLVNNAGAISAWAPVAECDPLEWWQIMEVNVKGSFLMLHAFLPLLVATAEQYETYVNVVNMSSIGGVSHFTGFSAYGMAKAALVRMSEFIESEYAEKGVSSVSIHPGSVMTQLTENVESIQEFLIDTPELCGGWVVWLTAQQRPYLNGRFAYVNWDVEVLESRQEEIIGENKLKLMLTL